MFAGLKIYLQYVSVTWNKNQEKSNKFTSFRAKDINSLLRLTASTNLLASARRRLVVSSGISSQNWKALHLIWKKTYSTVTSCLANKKTSIKLTKWYNHVYNHFFNGYHHAASFCPSFILLKTLPKRSADQHWIRSQLWHRGVLGSTSGYPNWSMEASKDMSAEMVNSQSGPS